MAYSDLSMSDCFSYANICPQEPNFNRGKWKQLEEQVRQWVLDNDSLYIVSGVYSVNSNKIGPNKILVPDFYYKAILDYTNPDLKAIAFVFPNTKISEPIQNFAISVDSLETLTKIDFFPLIPDIIEKDIESNCDLTKWNLKKSKEEIDKLSQSVQCKGITKQGQRCKHMTYSSTGYCFQHENQSKQQSTNKETNSNSSNVERSTYGGDKTIHTGPRGGKYYINSSGKKTYVRRK